MYDSGELRKGLRIELENIPYIIVETQFVKPGKGQAFTRLKLKNLLNGAVIDRNCKIGEKIKPSDIAEKSMQFLYLDKGNYLFMDLEDFTQVTITKEQVGEDWKWLIENMELKVMIYNEQPVGIELPPFSEQKIISTEAGIKGDRVSKAMKPATVETGALIQVPIFINEGDKIKIDTRSGVYMERMK